MSDDTLKSARSIALEVFHNCVDSDDGSHCLDTAVAANIIAEAISSTLTTERAAHEQTKRERDELAKYFADSCSILERLASTAAAVENSLVEVEKALEPFADIAGEPWADENGWTEAACRNDRICDWFGPSAFYTARRALTGGRDD